MWENLIEIKTRLVVNLGKIVSTHQEILEECVQISIFFKSKNFQRIKIRAWKIMDKFWENLIIFHKNYEDIWENCDSSG